MDKRKRVEEIARINNNGVTADACKAALRDGSDAALTKALVTARENGTQLQVVILANEALGFGRTGDR